MVIFEKWLKWADSCSRRIADCDVIDRPLSSRDIRHMLFLWLESKLLLVAADLLSFILSLFVFVDRFRRR